MTLVAAEIPQGFKIRQGAVSAEKRNHQVFSEKDISQALYPSPSLNQDERAQEFINLLDTHSETPSFEVLKQFLSENKGLQPLVLTKLADSSQGRILEQLGHKEIDTLPLVISKQMNLLTRNVKTFIQNQYTPKTIDTINRGIADTKRLQETRIIGDGQCWARAIAQDNTPTGNKGAKQIISDARKELRSNDQFVFDEQVKATSDSDWNNDDTDLLVQIAAQQKATTSGQPFIVADKDFTILFRPDQEETYIPGNIKSDLTYAKIISLLFPDGLVGRQVDGVTRVYGIHYNQLAIRCPNN